MLDRKESQERKLKVFKTGVYINHQTTVSAIEIQPKRRISPLVV